MRVKVAIFLSEIVISPGIVPELSYSNAFPASTVRIYVDINIFDGVRRSRRYNIISSTSPILPCEQMTFFKEFVNCESIADLLRIFERELVFVSLWAERSSQESRSPCKVDIMAEFHDSVFNLLYPYSSLNPSYDHLARRLHLQPTKTRNNPCLLRVRVSVDISEDISHPPVIQRQSLAPKLPKPQRQRKLSNSTSHRPSYAKPTFSWLMTEYTTRQQFRRSLSCTNLDNGELDCWTNDVRVSSSITDHFSHFG